VQRHIENGGAAVTGVWRAENTDRMKRGYVDRLFAGIRARSDDDEHVNIVEAAVLPVMDLLGVCVALRASVVRDRADRRPCRLQRGRRPVTQPRSARVLIQARLRIWRADHEACP
jgi:hypothetical protein